MTIIIPREPVIPREPRAPDNTQRAKSTRQYLESQKRQTIPGEPKVPDNTRRAKSARQYPESEKHQTIPGDPRTCKLLFLNYSVHIKCSWTISFLLNNDQNNTWRASYIQRAKGARQHPESQKCQTIPGELRTCNLLFFQNYSVCIKMFLDNIIFIK